MAAVGSTLRFLLNLKVPRELLAPLIEAAQIIKRDIGYETLVEQRQVRDIWDSAVVSLHQEEGVKLEDAAKKIHDHDPGEPKRLLVFRNNMRKGKSVGMREARNLYHLLKMDFREPVSKKHCREGIKGQSRDERQERVKSYVIYPQQM